MRDSSGALRGVRGRNAPEIRPHSPAARARWEAVEAWETQNLPPTEGEWRRKEFELLRRGATAGRVEFHNTGLGGAVRLRSVRVVLWEK